MLHKSILILFMSLMLFTANGQNQQAPEIQLKVSKISALINFLEYANNDVSSKKPMVRLIHEAYGEDEKFRKLVEDYKNIRLNYSVKLPEYPEQRYSTYSSYKFVLIAAAKSTSIDEFKDRIIGLIPISTHSKYISIIEEIEPYYDELIGNKVKKSNNRIIRQIT